MRLPAEKIKAAILDPDRELRQGAVDYFALPQRSVSLRLRQEVQEVLSPQAAAGRR